MAPSTTSFRFSRASFLVLAAYVLAMAGVVWLVFAVRDWAIAELNTPEAQAQWRAFVEDEAARQQDPNQPVRRRVPTSPEPPTLVLLRDYFRVMLAGGVVFGSLLFAVVVLAIRGLFGRSRHTSANLIDRPPEP